MTTRTASLARLVGGGATVAAVATLAIVGLTTSSDAGGATCRGQAATIVGTDGRDVINAGPGRDVIAARGGNDDIDAGAGRDLVCGGAGRDRLDGGGGADRCRGGPGRDREVSC